MSLFGQPQKPAEAPRFGTLFGSSTAPSGSLFGTSQPSSQPAANTFGSTSTAAPTTSLFGAPQQQQQNAGNSLFGASQAQQQQQQQPQTTSLFGGSVQAAPQLSVQQQETLQSQQKERALPRLGQTLAAESSSGRVVSVQEQMMELVKKWSPESNDTVFQTYFYNEVQPDHVPFYAPTPEDIKEKWEEALSNKPGPNAIPVLAKGFRHIGARIHLQQLAIGALRTRLHEVNNSLSHMKDKHELDVASRITEARRKHIVFTQRCLALATKVQILRNRGYAMDTAEEELRKKLVELEKKTFDPVLGGRQEEIWARMSGVRERARILQDETEKLGKAVENQQDGDLLSEEDQKQVEELLKKFDKQLEHLKNEVDETRKEYDEWQGQSTANSTAPRR
ncbi:hypothetical protein GQ43DRAFT_482460 [Delitschia confertaspora ATCC 74209]|uniref:Nucleoporin Nup54 alpha-helical domain-containing protein n=1 Tax=Delitschia confertaspora ATCC 74209 TaxID=1513339 RepID=A0A9P4JHD8_9PLEO|nr:hypothetical protein GQ43DRAFT_482460 [Delitschia confertaspora ATCC 74209]